ncbi:cation:proton antiporter [Isoptericola halotolerans]|uniref:Kef-type K+ transport system membrane component KefB n=1 Tax=Isoptericola halotolerans TaxID=300560 RepID=A0ABX2A2K7_9MICO|nr:cation:proton antiporter family protein [Isoptericola halotolerans]NOV97024.1 Kef-type K+ transport system membrane component KefB [Isoptericola halotolerans]
MTGQDLSLLAAILAVAALVGLVATRLRQPLIVSFIGVGILVGPVGTGWATDIEEIELLGHLGITILLFLVGLKLDLHLIRTTGPVALATGLGQVAFTAAIGYGIALALGMDHVTAIYVAVALTFSSTIIIVKLLSDKREIDELHGRIAVGFLIVQDLVVVLVMIALTAFGQETSDNVALDVVLVIGKGVALLAGVALTMRYVIPRLLPHVARSQELLVLFAIAWAVSIAATSAWLGFSTEVGAFLAGMSLASTPFREAIGARLVSLRDFLLLFFFLALGAQLEFADASRQLGEAAVLSAFVLVGNPLIVLVIMGFMGYPVRVSFKAGLTVAQISEFSLILAALGLSLGHITSVTVSLITVVGLITIGASTYMILYSQPLFEKLQPVLGIFQRDSARRHTVPDETPDADILVYGLGRLGGQLVDRLTTTGTSVVAVDFDPDIVNAWNRRGVTAVFGSAEDIDLLESLPLAQARWVVCTVPSSDANLTLLHALRHHGYPGHVALTALSARDARRLEATDADVVIEPYAAATAAVLDRITDRLGADDERDTP